ncbi:MAG TPA: tail fiber protein [Blastocatellia bacterium]|nr:tail fiber protein [Blastocatellia bacterium]
MSEPFLGMIAIYPYSFAPRGWAFCQGQILPIAQNTALFSLLGTTFGGNGQTTFGLPDLRGRFPNSSGQGPGLSSYDLGQVGGTESVTLTINQLPAHTHPVAPAASTNAPSASKPTGNYPAAGNFYDSATNAAMGSFPSGPTGGNQPAGIINPYLTLNYCIALEGIYPSRN